MNTEKINLHCLRNDEHFQFNTEFCDLVKVFTPTALKIQPQFDAFLSLYAQEDEALKKILKSAITEDIQVADHVRDLTFRGIADAAKAALNHFNPETKAAAKRMQVLFDTYGNLAPKPLNEETSAIYNLLQELKGTYAADVNTVGITDWVAELEANNTAFDKLIKDRYDESAARSALVLKQVRTQIDVVYRIIIKRIDALAVVEDNEANADFIRKWNVVVDKYKNAILQRQGKNAAKTAKTPPAN